MKDIRLGRLRGMDVFMTPTAQACSLALYGTLLRYAGKSKAS